MNFGGRFLLAVVIGGLAACAGSANPMTVARPHVSQVYDTAQDAARAVAASQAAQAQAKGVKRIVLYQYYPGAEVYYAPQRNCYIWRGTRGWIVTAEAPKHLVLDTAKAATVDLERSGAMVIHLGKTAKSAGTIKTDARQEPPDKQSDTDQDTDQAQQEPVDEPN